MQNKDTYTRDSNSDGRSINYRPAAPVYDLQRPDEPVPILKPVAPEEPHTVAPTPLPTAESFELPKEEPPVVLAALVEAARDADSAAVEAAAVETAEVSNVTAPAETPAPTLAQAPDVTPIVSAPVTPALIEPLTAQAPAQPVVAKDTTRKPFTVAHALMVLGVVLVLAVAAFLIFNALSA